MTSLTSPQRKKRSAAKGRGRRASAGDNAQKVFRNFLRLLEKAHARALSENAAGLQQQSREHS